MVPKVDSDTYPEPSSPNAKLEGFFFFRGRWFPDVKGNLAPSTVGHYIHRTDTSVATHDKEYRFDKMCSEKSLSQQQKYSERTGSNEPWGGEELIYDLLYYTIHNVQNPKAERAVVTQERNLSQCGRRWKAVDWHDLRS